MRDEIIGAQEEAHRLHELRQGAVSELSRLRYAEEELEQVDTQYNTQLEDASLQILYLILCIPATVLNFRFFKGMNFKLKF